jgi:hypothetical protein
MTRRSSSGGQGQDTASSTPRRHFWQPGVRVSSRHPGLQTVAVERTESLGSHSSDDRQSPIRQFFPLFFLIAAFSAAAAGDFLIRWGSGSTPNSQLFAGTEQFDEWSAIVSFVTGVSFAVASFTWPHFLRTARDTNHLAIISAAIIYLLIGAAAVLGPFLVAGGNSPFELSYFYLRMGLLAAALLAAGTGSFCGLVLIWYNQRAHIDDAGTKTGIIITSILSARRDLQRFFAGATVLITGAVVIIGGLRSTLNADSSANYVNNVVLIPVEALILFGIFYAMLLAFVLVPAYIAWQTRAAGLRDRVYPIPDDGPPTKDWYKDRSDLEDLIGMHLGTTSRFLTIAGVLAPLIASIIAAVIPAIHS